MPHIWTYLAAVPRSRRSGFAEAAKEAARQFYDAGALTVHDAWELDEPSGGLTSFPTAVHKAEDEGVVFGYVIWPDAETAEACMASMGNDPKWACIPFLENDGRKLLWGRFEPLA
ncbi:Uncharacterized conserved protein YbaA, DUF1428 family [Palleronia marisminoris]|uniref:DUF1428 domain-containing protein n=1 Tax=Palleronia marisminoris TaxID=315423 RepID=A0A1Y5RMZ4_9RHOB|nr:DUF1428 family protein [Palleronia marisminoris]SFG23725.1 Uncharacterized conserved protein YbaA, DUF1428 family [Palleronia marisminoris]SLN18593.1 hypothetical protein PAM7066_00607 [Palleronia marisminoris]